MRGFVPPLHGHARSRLVDVPSTPYEAVPLVGPTREPTAVRAEVSFLLLSADAKFPFENEYRPDEADLVEGLVLMMRAERRARSRVVRAELAALEAWERAEGA